MFCCCTAKMHTKKFVSKELPLCEETWLKRLTPPPPERCVYCRAIIHDQETPVLRNLTYNHDNTALRLHTVH